MLFLICLVVIRYKKNLETNNYHYKVFEVKMPLSDQEIEALLNKAKSYEGSAARADAKGSERRPYFEQALNCYNKIIDNIPNHDYYYGRRSRVNYNLARTSSSPTASRSYLESAIDDISKAIELETDKEEHYRARGLYCFEKLSRQEVMDEQLSERIIKDYHTCKSKNPTQPEAWLHLLSLNLILQNYGEAISIYGQCKPYINDKEDQLVRAWFGCIAIILAGESAEEEDMKPLYNQKIRLNSVTLIQLTMSPLKRLLEKEKNEEIHKKVTEINKLLFSHIDGWFKKGFLLNGLGRYDEAIKAYEKAIEVNPNNADAHNNLGHTYSEKGMFDEAILAYKEAIAINPNDVVVHNNLGNAYDGKRMYDEAILAFKKAIAINPDYALAHNNLGLAYRKKEACDNAILACKKIIALDPSYANMLSNRVLEHLKPHREGTKHDGGAGESMKQKLSSLKDWILGKLNRH